jgi:hypothetical protein
LAPLGLPHPPPHFFGRGAYPPPPPLQPGGWGRGGGFAGRGKLGPEAIKCGGDRAYASFEEGGHEMETLFKDCSKIKDW